MNYNASNNYLATAVMTATPQKLHLMLIDAAIRECERARIHWQAGENEKAAKFVRRAQDIVYGIIDGIDYKTQSELVGKVAGIYLFIYTSIIRSLIDNDLTKLDEALRILSIERETWRQVCEQLAASPADQTPPQPTHAPLAPNFVSSSNTLPDLPTSFSLEA